MLVNQAVRRIPPQQTVLRDLSNRRIAFDWNIQEFHRAPVCASAKSLGAKSIDPSTRRGLWLLERSI